ncbi:MAG: hypothetical protein FWH08_01685 [Oscillospiraceae bacterium]|nr:hypothetical protein [Oscillospiraceae bacterium]
MIKAKKRPFEQAVEFLPVFKDKLMAQNPLIREKTREIRLRAGQPVTLETDLNNRLYLDVRATSENLRDLIELFCDYSVHSYARQLSQGFITLEGGHRAGFCGTAVVRENRVEAIRDITSINLRIAREFIGCSDILFNSLPIEDLQSLLILGKPMSAKTTVLRDLARNLSQNYKVAVIDERGELAGKSALKPSAGGNGLDLGINTDVLDSFPKGAGFMTALRALSPDFIVCDEITGEGASVTECFNCGVGVIMTAHCGSLKEALNSPALSDIISSVDYIALLGTGKNIGKLQGLWCKNEDGFSGFMPACGNGVRLVPLGGA